MTKKEKFIAEIKALLEETEKVLSEDANTFLFSLESTKETEKPMFTENGIIILNYMRENKDDFNNLFKAKDIAEGIGKTSKTVSGAIRKLCTDGYVEKLGESPKVYSLTSVGETVTIEVAES